MNWQFQTVNLLTKCLALMKMKETMCATKFVAHDSSVLLLPRPFAVQTVFIERQNRDCGNVMRGEARAGRGLHEKRRCICMGNDSSGLIKRNGWMKKRR